VSRDEQSRLPGHRPRGHAACESTHRGLDTPYWIRSSWGNSPRSLSLSLNAFKLLGVVWGRRDNGATSTYDRCNDDFNLPRTHAIDGFYRYTCLYRCRSITPSDKQRNTTQSSVRRISGIGRSSPKSWGCKDRPRYTKTFLAYVQSRIGGLTFVTYCSEKAPRKDEVQASTSEGRAARVHICGGQFEMVRRMAPQCHERVNADAHAFLGPTKISIQSHQRTENGALCPLWHTG
jgi:hypothetical protein